MRRGHTKVTDAFFNGITCVLKTLVDPARHYFQKSTIYVEKLSYLLVTITVLFIIYLLLFNIYYTIIFI